MIKIVDCIMGGGKTSWSIQHMNKSQKENKRYVYVTPYLTEVERIKKECGFYEPESSNGSSKVESFKLLLSENKNITTTHALFKLLDQECLDLLSIGYTLILDEVLDVVQQTNIAKGDIDNMIKLKILSYKSNGELGIGDIKVVQNKACEDNEYKHIASNLLRNNLEILQHINTYALIWLFPIDLLNSFEDVYIMTFMFDGYPMKYYLDTHNIKQEKYSVTCINSEDEYENRIFKLVPYFKPDLSNIKKLLHITDKGKLNEIGEKDFSFTFSWWEKLVKDKNHTEWINIRKNVNNFLKNVAPSTSKKRIIWTTFTKARSSLYSTSLTDDNFVANNIRATNDYKEMDIFIYLVNKRYNPFILRWFLSKNIRVDEDVFALGEMVQCLWRSAIRDNNPISLYIPSKRMRDLLEKWLDNKI